jgi:hypothetical protein
VTSTPCKRQFAAKRIASEPESPAAHLRFEDGQCVGCMALAGERHAVVEMGITDTVTGPRRRCEPERSWADFFEKVEGRFSWLTRASVATVLRRVRENTRGPTGGRGSRRVEGDD